MTRPLSAGGVYGGFARRDIQPRGEIWILDPRLDHPRCLSLGDLWAWAPSFSPSGARLAALVSAGDGRVGLTVWEMHTGNSRMFPDIDLDIYGTFGGGGEFEARPSAEGQFQKQFLWNGDDEIIFAQSGGQGPQFELDITSASRTYESLHERSSRGVASVRVWGKTAPVCGSTRNLARIKCTTGEVQTLYRGATRGASMSPDCKWLAALVATGHATLPASELVTPAVFSTSVGDDPLVSLALVLIELNGPGIPRRMDGFSAVGVVVPRRLPRWSPDSQRLAVPARCRYTSELSSGDDACWCVSIDTMQVKKWQASSALDAELLAALSVAVPGDRVEETLQGRPALSRAPSAKLRAGESPGAVWNHGAHVAVWDHEWLTLFQGSGWRRVIGGCRSVFAPVQSAEAGMYLAVADHGRAYMVHASDIAQPLREVRWDGNWTYLGLRGADDTVIAKSDSDSETCILAVSPRSRVRRSPLVFNPQFREIIKPSAREVFYRTPDDRELKGVLQLPVGRFAMSRHPVILWAYPNSEPALDNWLTRLNTDRAVWRPFQFLLTRGFAVFHVPLSMPAARVREPLQAVTEAVLPWLDVLDEQPEILPGEYGFFGHSDAGYVALALEAMTSRFKAIVAYSTFPDLGANTLAAAPANMALDCAGQAIQANRFYYEDPGQPYGLGAPFWTNEETFIRNSPLYRMQAAATPLLLLQSEFDYGARGMEAIFSILYGMGVPVELAYYWGEGHLISSPGNILDVWNRTAGFFRTYLHLQE